MEDNFLSIPQYAALKRTYKERIYNLIERELIIPTVVAGKRFIDITKYGDFDPNAQFRAVTKMDAILNDVKQLKAKVKHLENIVYAPNENGRGPSIFKE